MCEYKELIMMKKKGSTQTGLYEKATGKWIKWVGKKELNKYLVNGVELKDFN